ncbi:MAG: CoA ester lyase [Acidimicrobiia bacterium]|nr:CoA ester lyase [Acidimicrobiia bacterium]
MNAPVARLRSALFVPAHRRDFQARAVESGADAVILDLEDSVPVDERAAARAGVTEWLAQSDVGPAVCVRINAPVDDCLADDLDAVVRPGLVAVMVPKVTSPREVQRVAKALDKREKRAGLPSGSVRIWPSVENAVAVRRAFKLASASPRVAYMGGAAALNGDLGHAIGFGWTPPLFLETLALRSGILVDMRAAGVQNPMTGVVTNLRDLDEVEAFARQSRTIGYEGMMVIHPSHVAIVNEVFGATSDDVAAAKRLLDAWDGATRDGLGAVDHEGQMIDAAMVRVARDLLARHAHSAPTERAPVGGVSPTAASEAMQEES